MSHDMSGATDTNAVCEHVCMHVGQLEGGGFLDSSLLNEVTSMPEGEKGYAMRSPSQWTPVRCPGPQQHRRGLSPVILNYTIVLSNSILPRLVRHHLLSPQKAL